MRTFGCQMNEHDSERIAGLLEADGLRPADDADAADVVVLNTCCIRENADNKLYGHLGQLKSRKAERPDMQIVVGGCLAQKDRDLVVEKAPHVDVVLGTHNVGRAAELLGEQRGAGRSVVEILEETAADDLESFPSALPSRREVPYAGWVTIQIGCDNSCAFCIVPSVRGREISRPFDDVVGEVEALAADGVTEVTLLGQNVNSYGRDLPRRRPLFAGLLRQVEAQKAEIAALRPAYDRWIARGGRRLDRISGRTPDEIVDLMLDLARDPKLESPMPGYPADLAVKFAADDLKHAYYQAALAQPGAVTDIEVDDWFFGATLAGQLLFALRAALLESVGRELTKAVDRRATWLATELAKEQPADDPEPAAPKTTEAAGDEPATASESEAAGARADAEPAGAGEPAATDEPKPEEPAAEESTTGSRTGGPGRP